MVTWESRKLGDFLWLANGLVLMVLINLLAGAYFFRLDLTEEKRYSIKEPTRELLGSLDDDVYIEVFLDGDLNAGFRRFRKAIEETLEEFRVQSHNHVHVTFTDPAQAMSQKAQNEFIRDLAQKGITATNVVEQGDGNTAQHLIFPGALVYYGGYETGVMLLKGNKAESPEEEINQSIEGVEYEIANAIYKLVNTDRKRVGLITGHGELDSLELAAFNNALLEQYDVRKVQLTQPKSLPTYDVLVLAKPTAAFTEVEKYNLDQYIMQGGQVMFLIDQVSASMDSAANENYLALPMQLNLDDLLFKYGVRINYDLVQDKMAALYPVMTGGGQGGSKPRMEMLEWPFYPLINHYAPHPITRNLDAVVTRFVSSIDTVKAPNVKKTPLLLTSSYARTVPAPVNVRVEEVFKNFNPKDLAAGSGLPVGYLLEGTFTSVFKNRFVPEGVNASNQLEESVPTKLIVIADGDLARNEINPRTGQPQMLGFDPFVNYTFANSDLLMNAMAYLTQEDGLITARNKEISIRPLNHDKLSSQKTKWQIINLVLPLVLLVGYGVVRAVIRKRKFGRF